VQELVRSDVVAVESQDGVLRVFITNHVHKAEAAAAGAVIVAHNLHACDASEWAKELVQEALIRLRREIRDVEREASGTVR
jgi:hypothetical protein